MKKHLNVLPSVVVVFADIDWTDPDTRAVVSTVARVRQLLSGRLTKVVVVLLQTDTGTPTAVVMTARCANCGLSSRAISGVLHRSLKNNVSINFNINVDEKSSFQK